MKTICAALLLFFFFSCGQKEEDTYHTPENALDAGREFIQLSLQGKFNQAGRYMLQDDENRYWLSKWTQDFSKITEQQKAAFAKSSINITEVADVVPDSITVIVFSNSFKKSPQKVKVVKYKSEWKVDFKYTFSGNL